MGNKRQLPFASSNVELEYNGYKFYETSRCQVKATPVYQEDGMHVKYVRYTLTVHALVVAGDVLSGDRDPADDGAYFDYPLDADETTDVNLYDLRNKLTQPRKALSFNNLGFGRVDIDPGTSNEVDVDYGPKPTLLIWEPIGSDQAARVIWTVEFCLPECKDVVEGNSSENYKFIEYWYTESISMDKHGFSTIKIDGYVEISYTPYNEVITDYLLSNRDMFIPPVAKGFIREDYNFTASPNGKSATFSVTDRYATSDYELQKGVSQIEATHSLSNVNDNSGVVIGANWLNTLRVKIKLHSSLIASKTGRQIAWLTFLRMLDERLGEGYRTSQGTSFPLVKRLSVDHDLTEPSFTFVCSWVLVVNTYDDIFARSNFWNAGYDYLYANPQSVGTDVYKNSIYQFDGGSASAKVEATQGNKKIKNYCSDQVIKRTLRQIIMSAIPDLGTTTFLLNPQCPPEQLSYVAFRNNFQVLADRQVAINYTLQSPDQLRESLGTGSVSGGQPKLDNSHEQGTSSPNSNVIVQRMGNSTVKVLMWGYAIKYNTPSTIPEMTTYGGKKAILLKEIIEPAILVEENPCPLYVTKWYKIYQLEKFAQDTEPSGRGVINGLQSGTTNPQDPTQNNNTIESNGYI